MATTWPDYISRKAMHQLYLQGREDAEEDFDVEDFDIEEMAQLVLDGDDLRKTVGEAVEASLANALYSGMISEWIDDNEDELAAACDCEPGEELHAMRGSRIEEFYWPAWKRGFTDEATMALEDEVVDQMEEMLDDEDDDEAAAKVPTARAVRLATKQNGGGITYYGYAEDGRKDARSSWDDSRWEIVEAVVEAARGQDPTPVLLGGLAVTKVDELLEEDKEQWLEQNAEDAVADGLDPEKAYDLWWGAYKHRTAQMVAERAAERIRSDAEEAEVAD